MNSKKQKKFGFKKNVGSGMLCAFGNIAVLLVSYPVYLRYLGTERYGLWAIFSVIIGFAAIGKLGIDSAVTKYVSEEYGRGNSLGIEKYFSTAIISLLFSAVFVCIFCFLLKRLIIEILNIPEIYISVSNRLFPYMVVLSVLVFFIKVADATLRGIGRVDLANYYNLGTKIISVVVTIIFLKFDCGIWSLLGGQVLFYTLWGFLALLGTYRELGSLHFSLKLFDLGCLRKIIGFGGVMTTARLVSMFLVPFNKVIISKYAGLDEVTYFDIANRGVRQFRNVFVMGIRAIMPEISRLSVKAENAKDKIHEIFKKSMRLISHLAIPMMIILFLLAPSLLRLWLSNQYVPKIADAFRLMLVGSAMNLLVIPIYYLFMGIGKIKYCFINHFIQAFLNFIFVSLFIILGIMNFHLCIGIYSFSIVLSSILLILLFLKYKKHQYCPIGS